ncbi:DinB family protein [Granulicella sp. dw_53]|uniref:DinB family protein n=1 Tax=Granulicella sp. dw_53 TaxID=2719792 RepID=UPI001BD60CBC|nr:DinB family protein [Granulicella sp. dw_53]
MTELALAIIGDSAAAPALHILEGISEELAHRKVPNIPHTIYEELWHLAFWQQVTLDWIRGIETPFPAKPADGFPPTESPTPETFEALRHRFLQAGEEAAAAANDTGQTRSARQLPLPPRHRHPCHVHP